MNNLNLIFKEQNIDKSILLFGHQDYNKRANVVTFTIF